MVPRAERDDRGAFINMHKIDLITQKQATDWLLRAEQEWLAKKHPRGQFARSLIDQREFKWPNYIAGRPWNSDLAVRDFWLVWHMGSGMACFAFKYANGEIFTVMPCRKQDIVPGVADVCWS